jgi:hypothetical protein
MKKNTICLFILFLTSVSFGQNYLSSLNAESGDPVFTTYASAPEGTKYSTDVAYQLIWKESSKEVLLHSEQSGSIGIIIRMGDDVVSNISEMERSPVVTTSYSNLFNLNYSPFTGIELRYSGLVRDSETLIIEVEVSNKNNSERTLLLYPYIHIETGITAIKQIEGGFFFSHSRKADKWMKDHSIPYAEELNNYFLSDAGKGTKKLNDLKREYDSSNTAALEVSFNLKPGSAEKFRILRSVSEKSESKDVKKLNEVLKTDIQALLKRNEDLYKKVPVFNFTNSDKEALYWNSFNLLRQCMMAPEGKATKNYYVFSREPKWGWGYGGQVFHESMSMLAYVYLDPAGAMNSQRVFMERQHQNGYINYRTGPYLDEQIPTNGKLTTSAPLFNWLNYEIYKITRDKNFLQEAYTSGRKFYEYYSRSRDTDSDGLCEWGGDGVFESLRDSKSVIWDEVGKPENFEAVDCNMMLVKEAKSLAEIAEELGLLDDVSRFRRDAAQRTYLINRFMWDDSTGFYYSVNKGDHTFTFRKQDDMKRKEIIGFLALWSGVADKAKAAKLVEHLNNPDEFNRKFGIPSLSADDPYYNAMGYWNGPVWLPWQYMIFRGLIDYGYKKEALDLKERVMKNAVHQLKQNNNFWEAYSPDDFQAGWHKPYTWSGILARFIIDENNLLK